MTRDGRPRRPRDLTRPVTVSFRVSDAERKYLTDAWHAANQDGGINYWSESDYWRNTLLADAKKRLDPSTPWKAA